MSIEASLERILANQQEMRREMAELRALLLSRLPELPELPVDGYEDVGMDPPLAAQADIEELLQERAYRPTRRVPGSMFIREMGGE